MAPACGVRSVLLCRSLHCRGLVLARTTLYARAGGRGACAGLHCAWAAQGPQWRCSPESKTRVGLRRPDRSARVPPGPGLGTHAHAHVHTQPCQFTVNEALRKAVGGVPALTRTQWQPPQGWAGFHLRGGRGSMEPSGSTPLKKRLN